MPVVNEHYLKLPASYLFPEIGRRVKAFQGKNPGAKLIRLGIGDVVLPLAPAVIRAMHEAVDEMGRAETFHGYGPEQGYPFLINSIIEHDYKPRGIAIKPGEVFVSDGSKCDVGNIQEIFSQESIVAVADPVYPVYIDTNVMAGRTGPADKNGRFGGIVYLKAVAENNFVPLLPTEKADLIYLCSPNNPTGMALDRTALENWVAYAAKNRAVILFDSAYEAYIQDGGIPHSIYEIEGARDVAIEFRSFSKTAGFTGTRCAYTVVPEGLCGTGTDGKPVLLNPLWMRRQTTKFNGVAYPVQKAAEACYSPEGKREIRRQIAYYMENAKLIREGLGKTGLEVFGGVNAPYIWIKTPEGTGSWVFFDKLMNEAHVVGTPGAGFGPAGEGYLRLSAFGLRENVVEAVERMRTKVKL